MSLCLARGKQSTLKEARGELRYTAAVIGGLSCAYQTEEEGLGMYKTWEVGIRLRIRFKVSPLDPNGIVSSDKLTP